MGMRALIFEHDSTRRRRLIAAARRALPEHEIEAVDRYSTFIEQYFAHGHRTDLISLGHGILVEPTDDNVGNGRLAASTLAKMPATAAVVIHSNDFVASREMQNVLAVGRWPVWTVVPGEGWDWIERDWAFCIAQLVQRKWISDWGSGRGSRQAFR